MHAGEHIWRIILLLYIGSYNLAILLVVHHNNILIVVRLKLLDGNSCCICNSDSLIMCFNSQYQSVHAIVVKLLLLLATWPHMHAASYYIIQLWMATQAFYVHADVWDSTRC